MQIRQRKAKAKSPLWIKAAVKQPRRLFGALKLCLTSPQKLVRAVTPTNPPTLRSGKSTSEAASSSKSILTEEHQESSSKIDETIHNTNHIVAETLPPFQSTSTSSTTSLAIARTPVIPPPLPSPATLSADSTMVSIEGRLEKMLARFSTNPFSPTEAAERLKWAKGALLSIDALLPTPETRPIHLFLARGVLEAGALHSISAQDADGFTRYWQQLQSFYELPPSRYPKDAATGQKNKITGLYLMLLLTKGYYAEFHTVLEGLEMENALKEAPSHHTSMPTGKGENAHRRDSLGRAVLEGDVFLKYPVMLEQWLMEGAYDRVWAAVKKDGVPSEEFAVFSEILEHTIRLEIASCSQKSYPFVPISSAKTLFFLDSEGAVLQFARDRGWVARDGRIYFPNQQGESVRSEREILRASGQVIENTIGYARELETIV